jgi:hypothetical protein
MKTYTITYDDGKNRIVWDDYPQPERLPQCGDVYEVVHSFYTLGRVSYEPGDRFTVLERTGFVPHHRTSSLGNLLVRCKTHTSVWTNFDSAIADGWLKLVEKP